MAVSWVSQPGSVFTNDSLLASIWLNKRPKKDCRIVIVVCLCGGVDGLILKACQKRKKITRVQISIYRGW